MDVAFSFSPVLVSLEGYFGQPSQTKTTKFTKTVVVLVDNFYHTEKQSDFLTLFQLGGGHYGPDDRKWSAISIGFGLGSPKFMTLFLSMFDRSQ